MIVILKEKHDPNKLEAFLDWLEDTGFQHNTVQGQTDTIVAVIGDTLPLEIDLIRSLSIVRDAYRVQAPYCKSSKKSAPEDATINIGKHVIGNGHFHVMAGPCSVESLEQISTIAKHVKDSGATFLRGGAFKPRTSPYSFQGKREEGLELLLEAKRLTGLPIVSEIMSARHIPLFEEIDILQVGARNMQNYELLKELGKINMPILLKRGLSATLEELLMSAEYIMSEGNDKVILCERGIRTFETATRNTLDLSAVPFLKSRSHLPVIVDPSHATGHSWMVPSLSKAAVAAGADGLLLEVHNDPEKAWSDGPQSLDLDEFNELMQQLPFYIALENKAIGGQ